MTGRYRDVGRAWLLALGLAVLSLTPGARAQAIPGREPQPFRLIWSSSAGCSGPEAFLQELASRTRLLREARASEHAITLIVATFADASGVRGELTLRKPDGELSVREVPGRDCHEVEAAMALIAALVVDPLAATQAHTGNPRPVPRPAPLGPRHEASTRVSLRVDPRLSLRTAMAPGWTPDLGAGVMLTHESSGLRPSVALSGHFAQATTAGATGSAELELAAARLTACPAGLEPAEEWDLRACAQLELGRLRGTGFRVPSPAQKSIFWSSVGLELSARYHLLGPLWAGAEVALAFPLTRERFYFTPTETVHRIPAAALSCGGGLGLRFF